MIAERPIGMRYPRGGRLPWTGDTAGDALTRREFFGALTIAVAVTAVGTVLTNVTNSSGVVVHQIAAAVSAVASVAVNVELRRILSIAATIAAVGPVTAAITRRMSLGAAITGVASLGAAVTNAAPAPPPPPAQDGFLRTLAMPRVRVYRSGSGPTRRR
jgi:hypothetical protein